MLETLDYIIRIGSTPTFLYFNLYKVKIQFNSNENENKENNNNKVSRCLTLLFCWSWLTGTDRATLSAIVYFELCLPVLLKNYARE